MQFRAQSVTVIELIPGAGEPPWLSETNFKPVGGVPLNGNGLLVARRAPYHRESSTQVTHRALHRVFPGTRLHAHLARPFQVHAPVRKRLLVLF